MARGTKACLCTIVELQGKLLGIAPHIGRLAKIQTQADVHSVIHDAAEGKSVVYADTSANATWGDYRNTHIFLLTWNVEGTRMTKIQDMMDSAGMLKRMAIIQEWQAGEAKT
jgi:hypothetical protein